MELEWKSIDEGFVIVLQVLQLSMLNVAHLHLLNALILTLELGVDGFVGRTIF